jgi:O-antigen/teichoic acid export membrane protein
MSIRRNTVYNVLGSIIPIAVSLVTIPIYLGLIGEARYGVLAIAWLLLGYFGLFDLGLGRATAQRIAALRDGTAAERAQTFWTALALNVGFGVIGGLLIWPIAAYFFEHVFKIDDALHPEMQAAIPWLVLAVPMATLSGVLSGALEGRERFLELNLISVLGSALFQLLPLAAAILLGADLAVLLPTTLFARLITLFVLFERCRKHIVHGHALCIARAPATQLLRFGGWVTVSSIVTPVMVVLDRLVIGVILGAKAVSYYTVTFQLGDRSGVVPFALSSALFPRFVLASGDEARRLAENGMRGVVSVMTPMMAMGIALMEPFLSWWINDDFANDAGFVGRILMLGFWINAMVMIPYAQLQAKGRPDLVAKCRLFELAPYFGLLYLVLERFGLTGAALAFMARIFIDFILFTWLLGVLKSSIRLVLTPVLIMGAMFSISIVFKSASFEWFVLVSVHSLVTLIWAWRQAPGELRTMALNKINKMIKNRRTI